MRILVLQSGGVEHFLAGAQAIALRYPAARLIGGVRPSDLNHVQSTGRFHEVRPVLLEDASTMLDRWGEGIDLCVVPFERRFGVYHWRERRVPIRCRIPRVASYNGRGTYREQSLAAWCLATFMSCIGLRSIHKPAVVVWLHLRQKLDIAGLFGLALLALLYRTGWYVVGGFGHSSLSDSPPDGRRRLVLFIPTMGMGGAQRQMVTFLRHLDRSQWDPELVLLDLPDKFFEPAVRALHVPVTYLNRGHEFWMTAVAWRLAAHLKAKPCHVLHSWMHYAAMLGAIAGGLARVPTVVGSLRSERPSRFPWFYPRWQRAIDVITTPLQAVVIANSEAVRRENRQWAFIPERKLTTIYNGMNLSDARIPSREESMLLRRRLAIPLHAPIVGIVGRLSVEKDHATFLRAAKRVAAARPEAHFLIVGDGPQRESLQRDICQSQMQNQVHLLGSRHDVLALIRLMDVLALTSESEGFPNVLLEAALVGTPAVTTAAGGAAEVVVDGETGFVVPCGDDALVGKRLLTLLNDPSLRRRMADKARQRLLNQFSAREMARRVQETYDRTPRQSTHRLKVCFASPYAYGMLRPASGLPIGGAEVQICALARELAGDDQFDVSILTSNGSRRGLEREGALTIRLAPLWGQSDPTVGTKAGGEAAPLQIQKQADGRTLREQCPPVLVVIARPIARAWFTALRAWTSVYAPVRQWTSDRFHEGRSLWQWVRAIKSMDADVYVMRCASPQVAYARLASWLLHKKFVYMVAHEIDLSGVYVRQQGTWGKRFEWGLRHADLIICQHEGQVRLLHERYDRAGCILPSLCPPAPGADGMSQRHMILWVARMDAWKQPDIFVELAARIPERSFVMVGPPSETEPADMAALRDRMAGLPNLTWIPGLPFEQVGRLFREALLFVNTSRAEGFPNTFLQAAASRVPIVSWSVDPDDVLERHGLGYCAGENWKQFEQSVRLVAVDIGLRERLGDNGQRYISERHDNARIARGFRELLLSLCKRPAPVDAPGPVDETLEPMTCKEIKL